MKNVTKFFTVSMLMLMLSFVAPSAWALDEVEKQCQKMAIQDSSVKPRELNDFIKACVAARAKDTNGNRFTWDRGHR